ncbi:hypothetical protein ACO0QE_000919 [Hanseniaspora vineae]
MLTVVILGTSGGPFEVNTQSFLVKQNDRSYLSVDCGCGLSSICNLFRKKGYEQNVNLYETFDTYNVEDSSEKRWAEYRKKVVRLTDPNVNVAFKEPDNVYGENLMLKTANFYSCISHYFITHPHLDHISGMILNSPFIFDPYFFSKGLEVEGRASELTSVGGNGKRTNNTAKSHKNNKRTTSDRSCSAVEKPKGYDIIKPLQKTFYGFHHTIKSIETHIFNCEIWPNLLYKNEEFLKTQILQPHEKVVIPAQRKLHSKPSLRSVNDEGKENTEEEEEEEERGDLKDSFEVTGFPILHGKNVMNPKACVLSSCFYIADKSSKESLIMFGDCESDSVYLPRLWNFLADEILVKGFVLKGIFIECSTVDMINVGFELLNTEKLYGHFIPFTLCQELLSFKSIIDEKLQASNKEHNTLANPYQDVFPINVFITHVKQTVTLDDPRYTILQQLKEHAVKNNINELFKFSIALNSHTYTL